MMDGWWWGGGWPWGGGMFLGPLFMLAVPVLLVVLIVWAVRAFTPREPDPGRPRSAREILDARFASGEIDREEYETRRKALEAC